MDVKAAVTTFGSKAVFKYLGMAAIKNETSIPEACLSLSIASDMITDSGWDARVEVPYTKIIGEFGVRGTDVAPKFGGQRADIAIYDEGKPAAIIEMKIIDEGRNLYGVVEDWKKISQVRQHLASTCSSNITGYVAALVCDVRGRPATETVGDLCKALALDPAAMLHGEKHEAKARGWQWLYVCAALA